MKRTLQFVVIFLIPCCSVAWTQSSQLEQAVTLEKDALIDLNFGIQQTPDMPQAQTLGAQAEREEGQYVVKLSWNASTSPDVVGYDVFRGKNPGGPYNQLNSSPHKTTSYKDRHVSDGETYYYVVKAVNSNGVESTFSNQAQASIP